MLRARIIRFRPMAMPRLSGKTPTALSKITFQEITAEGINLGGTIQTMAGNEQLDAHCNAVNTKIENNMMDLKDLVRP